MGRNAGVSAGHPLTTAAAFEILARGGNAFDAGVAALLVGGVVEQDFYSLGGEALVLVYPRSAGKVVAVVGQGWAPEGATIDWYTARGKTLDGKGLDPAVVPGALHAALTVLDQWGTMSFEAGRGAGDRIRRAGLSAAAAHGGGDRRAMRNSSRSGRTTSATGSSPTARCTGPAKPSSFPTLARTLTRMVEAERAHKARAAAPASWRRATASTRATSPHEMVGLPQAA